jgi:SAM-dependent methyltransferase
MWDERYAQDGFVYGTAPNDHLANYLHLLPKDGPILSLAEGEGRNAVAMALAGCQVVGVDQSSVGLQKAQRLAAERGVAITTQVADLASFPIQPAAWAGIVSIFCHLPIALRKPLHAACVAGLRPGGIFILEAYTPDQLTYRTGGPQDAALLMTLDDLKDELAGLDWIVAREITREIQEGAYHSGTSAVVQLVGVKPG